MQKLKNTINLGAAMLFVLSLVLFTFVYRTHERDLELLDSIHALEEQVAAQQTEIAKLQEQKPTDLEGGPESAESPAADKEVQSVSPADAEALKQVAKFARGWMGTESAQMTSIGKQLETNPGKAIEALEDLVPRMDKAKSYDRMELALLMLDQVDPKTSTPALRRLYDNGGSSFLRATLAGTLAKRGDDSILRDFLSDLAAKELRSPNPAVRRDAVSDLAQTKNPLSTPYIVGALKDENLRVRIEATYALGIVKGEAALQELYRLQENRSPAIRDAAARVLENLEKTE